MSHSDDKPTGPGATYVRVSKPEQDPQQQRDEMKARLACWKIAVPEDAQIEDLGGRRHHSQHRQGFQRLLAAARAHKISWILVAAQDRLGFSGVKEWFAFLHEFEQHGVEVWQAIDGKCLSRDDPGTWISSGFGAAHSKAEQVDKARRDLGKKLVMARDGRWTGGPLPFGMMVVCLSPDGPDGQERERWIVELEGWNRRRQIHPDGREVWWEGAKNFPKDRARADRLVLRPSRNHPERIEAVKLAYQLFTQESISMQGIALRLNDLKIQPHTNAVMWYSQIIKGLLSNPVYKGLPSLGRRSGARFAQIVDGRVELDPPGPKPGNRTAFRYMPRDQWVGPDREQFPPIVDPDTWEEAQRLLSQFNVPPRAPKNPRMYLSGLVYDQCGAKMSARCVTAPSRPPRVYGCDAYARYGRQSGCQPHHVDAQILEGVVDRYLEETGTLLESVSNGVDERALLAPLFEAQSALAQHFQAVRTQVERYLITALAQVLDPIPQPDGRTRFILDLPEGQSIDVTLPGSNRYADLQELISWTAHAQDQERTKQVEDLERKLAKLYQDWTELEGLPAARELARARLVAVEGELARARLDGRVLDGQLRELWGQLGRHALQIQAARRELRSGSERAKAKAVRAVIERIECRFEPYQRGKRTCSRLVGVTVIPALSGEVWSCEFDNDGGMRGSGSVVVQALTRVYDLSA